MADNRLNSFCQAATPNGGGKIRGFLPRPSDGPNISERPDVIFLGQEPPPPPFLTFHCFVVRLAHYPAWFVFGMRPALRAPLRAFDSDPARALRYASHSGFKSCFSQKTTNASHFHRPNFSTQIVPGTWRQRLQTHPARFAPRASFSTRTTVLSGPESPHDANKKTGSGQSRGKTIKYVVIGGTLLVGAVVFSDDVQHLYRAAARTGRVVGALAVCINE